MTVPDGDRRPTPAGVPPRVADAAQAVWADLRRLHAAWVTTAFQPEDLPVTERRVPRTARGVWAYRLWSGIGACSLVVAYPLFVLGLAARYYARRLDRLSAALGVAGVALLSTVVWGALTAATYLSPIASEGVVAVAVAGVVATASAVLALSVTRRTGRPGTVAVGYPLAVTALFLPPVVASLYSPTLASVVFPRSESLAVWLLDNVLAVGGVAAFIRATFELEGLAYVGMWFGLAVPTGWVLGALVTLATRVRHTGRSRSVTDREIEFS
ncbi:MAG: hypothetical protein ABEJ70_03720 [Halobacteriaceae archaeon]